MSQYFNLLAFIVYISFITTRC